MVVDARRSRKARTPFIIWRMLVGKHNEHEVELVRDMAHEMGVDSFSTGVLFVDTQDPAQVEQWLPTDPAYSCYDYGEGTLENTWSCNELWEAMVINWDGGVAPCCWLHDAQYDFGNVTAQTIHEIWNGPHYASARRTVGRHDKRPTDVPTICHRCRSHPHYMAY
jgi:radical SAM protein with 4Fe4S-binding SPASM domain